MILTKREKVSGIYIIVNPEGYCYIGRTVNLKERIKRYRGCRCYSQTELYDSINNFGWENHTLEMLELLNPINNLLNEREVYWIAEYRTNKNRHPFDKGLNLTDGGKGSKGQKATRQTKEKMSISFTGTKNSFYGMKHTKETRLKMSINRKGLISGSNNPKAKPCLNLETGIYYGSLKDGCVEHNIKYEYQRKLVLKGRGRFIYV